MADPTEPGQATEAETMHKRKVYRLQQEETRKKLKTVNFDETAADESAKLPKVSFFDFFCCFRQACSVLTFFVSRKNTTGNARTRTRFRTTSWNTPSVHRT